MDELLREKLAELSERMIDVMQGVTMLLEAEEKSPKDIDEKNASVADLAKQYARLLEEIPESERQKVERRWGRRVVDLRRLASKLPQKMKGQRVASAKDAGRPFLTSQRASYTPNSPLPRTLGEPQTVEEGFRVSGDVEAWCGPCDGLRDHTIVAMVGGQPKSVICQSCGGRHGYRTTPARSKGVAPRPTTAQQKGRLSREQLDARRKEEQRLALNKELVEATEVRPFSKRERYKAGQIIEHPQHGRGKIENILKGSLLVRFRDGLKSLSTL